MKKFILLLFFAFFFQNNLKAQFGGGGVATYDIVVKRDDVSVPSNPGYTNANVTLELKMGSTSKFNTFVARTVPKPNPDPNNANAPKTYTMPILNPYPPLYGKVTFTQPSNLYSGYYPLPTTVGDEVTISDPCMIDYYYQYGYGVAIKCTAANTYEMSVTKFLCHWCVDNCHTSTKNTGNSEASLSPNPSIGLSELNYNATEKEKLYLTVSDLNGKTVLAYAIDVRSGLNKLPIDLQRSLPGTYIVNWKSSNGKIGNLKLIKK